MIPEAELDAEVIESMESKHESPHVDHVFIPGDTRSDEIGKLREAGAEAVKRGDYNALRECVRQAEELEALPRIAPHWEQRFTCETCGPVTEEAPCVIRGHHLKTEGEHFATLDTDGRRDYLAQKWQVSAYRDSDGEINIWISPKDWPEVG